MAILAAIDENERSRRIVSTGAELAEKYDDTLVALHVVPEENYQEHERALEGIPGFEDFSIEQEQESAREFARRFVEEVVDGVEDADIEYRGRVGDVASSVVAEADQIDARYLVISGRRRSPIGKAVFGNTAQAILLNADCPVVSLMVDE